MTARATEEAIGRAVAFLRQAQLPHGEFKTLLGSDNRMSKAEFDSSPFVTSFVVYALSHVDCVRVEDMVGKALAFLRSEMEFGGVWRYYGARQFKHCRIPPDLDDTASAAYALRINGQRVPRHRWLFLYNRDKDGRFLTWMLVKKQLSFAPRLWLTRLIGTLQAHLACRAAALPEIPSDPRLVHTRRDIVQADDADPVVNANVILYLGEDDHTAPAIAYLIDLLRNGPGHSFSRYYKDVLALHYMVARAHLHSAPSLAAVGRPVVQAILGRQRADGSFDDPLSTALAVSALLTFAPLTPSLPNAVAFLLRSQRGDGSWAAHSLYSGPTEFWGSEELTTALCIEALARYRTAQAATAEGGERSRRGSVARATSIPCTRAARTTSAVAAQERPRLAFIYSARDALWPGMGRSLFAQGGAIGESLIRCERLIAERLGWSLAAVSADEQSFPEHMREPLLTAAQIALTEGWRERGVAPDVLVARCGGEFAAGYVQGILTLEDAIEMACRVSRFIQQGRGAGRMLAVRCEMDEVERLQRSSGLSFSLVTDEPQGVTIIACGTDHVAKVGEFLAAQRIENWVLPSAIAPHSPIVEEWKADILKQLSGKSSGSQCLPYYSATAGMVRDDCLGPAHFWRVVREPALIGRALQDAIADGCEIFVEIGGHPSLCDLIRSRADAVGRDVVSFPTMRRQEPARPVMDETAAALLRLGAASSPWNAEPNVYA